MLITLIILTILFLFVFLPLWVRARRERPWILAERTIAIAATIWSVAVSVYLSLAPFYEGVLAEGTQSQTTLRIERRTLLPAVVGAQLSHFARVGEGFTSESEEHGIDAEYRMFSAPDFPEICGAAARPAKLVARNTPVTLRVGELYPLRRLVILAVDVSNKTVGPVPIAVDVESKDPALLDLRADSALADAMLLPVASGRFYLRARSLCPGTRAQVQFLAIVQER